MTVNKVEVYKKGNPIGFLPCDEKNISDYTNIQKEPFKVIHDTDYFVVILIMIDSPDELLGKIDVAIKSVEVSKFYYNNDHHTITCEKQIFLGVIHLPKTTINNDMIKPKYPFSIEHCKITNLIKDYTITYYLLDEKSNHDHNKSPHKPYFSQELTIVKSDPDSNFTITESENKVELKIPNNDDYTNFFNKFNQPEYFFNLERNNFEIAGSKMKSIGGGHTVLIGKLSGEKPSEKPSYYAILLIIYNKKKKEYEIINAFGGTQEKGESLKSTIIQECYEESGTKQKIEKKGIELPDRMTAKQILNIYNNKTFLFREEKLILAKLTTTLPTYCNKMERCYFPESYFPEKSLLDFNIKMCTPINIDNKNSILPNLEHWSENNSEYHGLMIIKTEDIDKFEKSYNDPKEQTINPYHCQDIGNGLLFGKDTTEIKLSGPPENVKITVSKSKNASCSINYDRTKSRIKNEHYDHF